MEATVRRRSTSSSTPWRRSARRRRTSTLWASGSPRSWSGRPASRAGATTCPWPTCRFRDLMSERLGLPVVVDNDGNASMLAEARAGAARGASVAAFVALGTGIGSGLFIDGKVFRGARGLSPELGHVVIELDGPDCPGDCPGRGCFEVLVSGNAIGVLGRTVAAERPDSELGRRLVGGARDQRRDRDRARARRRRRGARRAGRGRPPARVRPGRASRTRSTPR